MVTRCSLFCPKEVPADRGQPDDGLRVVPPPPLPLPAAQAASSPPQAPAPPREVMRAPVQAYAYSRRSYRSSGRLVHSPERRDATPRGLALPADARNGAQPQAERAIGEAEGANGARMNRCVPLVSVKTLGKGRYAKAKGRAGFPKGAARSGAIRHSPPKGGPRRTGWQPEGR